MKINEVTQIEEGPIDFAKQAWAGAKGAVQGAAAGKGVLGTVGGAVQGAKGAWAKQGAANTQKDLINKVTTKAMASWGKQSQNLASSGQPVDANTVTQWYTNFSGAQPTSQPTQFNDVGIRNWLEKEIGAWMASRNQAQAAGAPAGDAQPEAPKAPAAPQTPKNPIEVTTPTGIKVRKQTDGKWVRQDSNAEVTDPKEIERLEALRTTAAQTRSMAGKPPQQPVPPQQPTTTQQPATAQQSAGTPQPAPTTAAGGDVFAGDTQQPAAEAPLPDVSGLTPEERAELRRQLQASMAA